MYTVRGGIWDVTETWYTVGMLLRLDTLAPLGTLLRLDTLARFGTSLRLDTPIRDVTMTWTWYTGATRDTWVKWGCQTVRVAFRQPG